LDLGLREIFFYRADCGSWLLKVIGFINFPQDIKK